MDCEELCNPSNCSAGLKEDDHIDVELLFLMESRDGRNHRCTPKSGDLLSEVNERMLGVFELEVWLWIWDFAQHERSVWCVREERRRLSCVKGVHFVSMVILVNSDEEERGWYGLIRFPRTAR